MSTRTAPPNVVISLPAALRNLAELALLLERIEHRGQAPDPRQYLTLVEHIQVELERHPRDEHLDTLLANFPATAEVYENLRYGAAGLCLRALEQSVESERRTRALLRDLAKLPPAAA